MTLQKTRMQLTDMSIPRETPPVTDTADDLLRDFTDGFVIEDETPPSQNGAGYHETPPDVDPTQDTGETAGADEAQPSYWQRHVYTVSAYLQREPKQYIVDSLLGVKDLGMIFGESGTGKTFVTLDMLRACACGDMFAGKFQVSRPLTTIYATGEGHGGLVNRLHAATVGYDADCLSRITILDSVPQMYERGQENGLFGLLRDWPSLAQSGVVPARPDVFVIDTMFNALSGADENSAKDMSIVFDSARKLRDALGCAVILIHHTNKSGVDFRGSSSIKGEMDVMLRTAKVGKDYQLACEKLKDGEPWPAQSFDLVAVGETGSARVFWQGDVTAGAKDKRTHADEALEFLQTNAGDKFTAATIAQEIGLTGAAAKNIYRDLKALKQAGSVLEYFAGKGQPAQWYCENE